jgi:hypothetical protein
MPLTEEGRRIVASGDRNAALSKRSESDDNFKRDMASELVFAWEDASAEVRPSLERAMFNVGIERQDDDWVLYLPNRFIVLGSTKTKPGKPASTTEMVEAEVTATREHAEALGRQMLNKKVSSIKERLSHEMSEAIFSLTSATPNVGLAARRLKSVQLYVDRL